MGIEIEHICSAIWRFFSSFLSRATNYTDCAVLRNRVTLANLFPSVVWYCWLGLLTCKTVSQITYTVLVETLNPAQSINRLRQHYQRQWWGGPLWPPNETGCKVAGLHSLNSCIYSVALHSWCQITPFTQSCIMSSGIHAPQIQIWPPRWPPQTAAARNAPEQGLSDIARFSSKFYDITFIIVVNIYFAHLKTYRCRV